MESKIGELQGNYEDLENELLGDTGKKAMDAYRKVSRWMFIAYAVSFWTSLATLALGILAIFSRWGSLLTWIAALVSLPPNPHLPPPSTNPVDPRSPPSSPSPQSSQAQSSSRPSSVPSAAFSPTTASPSPSAAQRSSQSGSPSPSPGPPRSSGSSACAAAPAAATRTTRATRAGSGTPSRRGRGMGSRAEGGVCASRRPGVGMRGLGVRWLGVRIRIMCRCSSILGRRGDMRMAGVMSRIGIEAAWPSFSCE